MKPQQKAIFQTLILRIEEQIKQLKNYLDAQEENEIDNLKTYDLALIKVLLKRDLKKNRINYPEHITLIDLLNLKRGGINERRM